MIIDIFGIAIVCCLIDQTSKISVIFMAVSIGILCALYEINIRRKLKIKKTQLLLFEVICVLGYSLSLLGENYSIYFFFITITKKKSSLRRGQISYLMYGSRPLIIFANSLLISSLASL